VPTPAAKQPPPRIQIQDVRPQIDCGRYPVKVTEGDPVDVSATIFKDGHDVLRAVVRYRAAGARRWLEAPLEPLGNDRWSGSFEPAGLGRWQFTVEVWVDRYATLLDELDRKLAAGQTELAGELSEAEALFGPGELETWRESAPARGAKDRYGKTSLDRPLEADVERLRARFGSWYELFPRSWGGFKGVRKVLPEIAELGFDVLYLPPIHPIGETNRKGRNNALKAAKGDPGSPWAIGAAGGGHDAIHAELGTLKDFDDLVAAARKAGIEVALDFAIQTSPDHPWLTEHPEWFNRRPDGTLKYAENPPKRYQDIYNVNWECEDWRGLWEEWRRIFLFWVEQGVKVYRVDNPHTKPIPFWEWLIAEVHKVDRDVIFLAEAFTKRAMMRQLAKIGFTQGYTYFTWKTSRHELTEYVDELAWGPEKDYFRPNFFANTPDILEAYLVGGGPAAFYTRFVLAATLSPTYGIYSGYEHYENVPLREGSEEYLDSEKYELKQRKLDGPMLPFIARVNAIRRENPALQHLSDVAWLDTQNDQLMAYVKQYAGNAVICVVNLDPNHAQEGSAVVPAHLGLPPAFAVTDQLSGERFDWRIGPNYVRLDPWTRQAHILRVDG
jgi:starch synthase (maltosyl-transferring)